MRPPVLRLQLAADELIVDNFAGGGGASTGIEAALGRSPDIAINHDAEALAMHEANHPSTRHFREDVFDVDPVAVCGGRPVGLAWFSPDCTFFSKSRGGKPFRDRNKARRRRGLAWVVVKWAKLVKPRVIALENVEEFADWGPLGDDGRPDPLRRGFTFRRWRAQLENLGYRIEDARAARLRLRRAHRAQAPLHRGPPRRAPDRLARADPRPAAARALPDRRRVHRLVDPLPQHLRPRATARRRNAAPDRARHVQVRPRRGRAIHRAGHAPARHPRARDRRAAAHDHRRHPRGARAGRAHADPDRPRRAHRPGAAIPRPPGPARHGLRRRLEARSRQRLPRAPLRRPRGGFAGALPLTGPAGTVTVRDHHAVVTSSLLKLYGTSTGAPLEEPMPTVTAGGWHLGEVRAFLLAYYGTEQRAGLRDPLPTVTTHDRFALVTVAGQEYVIADIGMRMLAPHELAAAQGFPVGYELAPIVEGKPLSKTSQIRMIGNSVSPDVAEAIARALFVEGAAAATGQLGLAGVA
jgi:DNA (cytosine-5)-methyltransferase 1